jgi:hypothetical protein
VNLSMLRTSPLGRSHYQDPRRGKSHWEGSRFLPMRYSAVLQRPLAPYLDGRV